MLRDFESHHVLLSAPGTRHISQLVRKYPLPSVKLRTTTPTNKRCCFFSKPLYFVVGTGRFAYRPTLSQILPKHPTLSQQLRTTTPTDKPLYFFSKPLYFVVGTGRFAYRPTLSQNLSKSLIPPKNSHSPSQSPTPLFFQQGAPTLLANYLFAFSFYYIFLRISLTDTLFRVIFSNKRQNFLKNSFIVKIILNLKTF